MLFWFFILFSGYQSCFLLTSKLSKSELANSIESPDYDEEEFGYRAI